MEVKIVRLLFNHLLRLKLLSPLRHVISILWPISLMKIVMSRKIRRKCHFRGVVGEILLWGEIRMRFRVRERINLIFFKFHWDRCQHLIILFILIDLLNKDNLMLCLKRRFLWEKVSFLLMTWTRDSHWWAILNLGIWKRWGSWLLLWLRHIIK